MKNKKCTGIWMDYSKAYVMSLENDTVKTTELESEFTWEEMQYAYSRNENLMHNKERNLVKDYFESIGNSISKEDEVVIFGPTNAKTELFNILTTDTQYSNIKLNVLPADKMTENQRNAFVKEYFGVDK
ncbi:MAG: hypothetical protein IPK96_12225 [Flammeovirgaceae bacterium]|nr:hypothetical protein [Flammeovirgaceae bacterium]